VQQVLEKSDFVDALGAGESATHFPEERLADFREYF
jgi:hypothetical protein